MNVEYNRHPKLELNTEQMQKERERGRNFYLPFEIVGLSGELYLLKPQLMAPT
jgi:hypothetical protein